MRAMSKAVASGFLILSFLVSISEANPGFIQCNCDGDERYWNMERLLTYHRISDLFLAVTYFSIPIEIIYFVSCSNFPFKCVLFQMGAFIIFCGLTHFLTFLAYSGQPTLHLVLAILVSKIFTAVVSGFTACTLPCNISSLLKIKGREFMLKKKASDLVREVGIIKRKKEAGMHVRMLTQEIRKSLDRHTIHNSEIKGSDAVKILPIDSPLAAASSGGSSEPGVVAAIRMLMLRLSNFNVGTPPELVPYCFPILVLVLPSGKGRSWSNHEIEIVRVVADQVAVALSHAAVLEESRKIGDALMEQNRALHQAKQDVLSASKARNAFHNVMSHGLRRPMHSISGLLSMLQNEKYLSNEKQLLVDTMVKT
ncbi:hypothetical protein RND71_020509 [Anisodus tanguticus]|uniref:Ethylene receptor 1-like N-terminal domain-containing protein n=1 Tax=Anisodus tanguticus TaxID=243964 RepID=A0AAE1S1M7_9SOLA|nr:hypothetical protein RND71_020509 [Anisodus tanguticus]